MSHLLNLSITLTLPFPESPPGVLARIELQCEQLALSTIGDLLHDPLMPVEREDLRWYLEEYWQWPYLEFAERGKQVEMLLVDIGKRLYHAVFSSAMAKQLVQTWQLDSEKQHQISIVSDIPKVLNLPWELLHDEHCFLTLRTPQPVSIVRRLPQYTQANNSSTPFDPPLRVLLATARPTGTGFVDPRSIARELVDELEEQQRAGTIALEMLRPPTLSALRHRLNNPRKPPIHILHFDGHGSFNREVNEQHTAYAVQSHRREHGLLAFEDEHGSLDLVGGETMAQVLLNSSVKLVILNACESARSSVDDAFSSVAAQLIQGGVDAVVAMSASILVASAIRYAKAFYHELARGETTSIAQERARWALHDDPRRHTHRRRRDEEGEPVKLQDWWLPHFYQQSFVELQPMWAPVEIERQVSSPLVRLSEGMPPNASSGFFGRAHELLQIERWLLQGQLVVIHGFGGIGKTALTREAADWLTRTRMYDIACFISFEHGGDATTFLNALGNFMYISDETYRPQDSKEALAHLSLALSGRNILVIVDNLESILPGGEAPLEAKENARLWDVLFELRKQGAGVLLTSRNTNFGDIALVPGVRMAYLHLRGLHAEDAYAFASQILYDQGIDRARIPYVELCDLLARLDYHPLVFRLVLPVLRTLSLSTLWNDLGKLLPTLVDDTATGRNRSLKASLNSSLHQLNEKQWRLLPYLGIFEGRASEKDLLAITEIPESEWVQLCSSLKQASLLEVEQMPYSRTPFLYFHPVFTTFLRSFPGTDEIAQRKRYINHYAELANDLYHEDIRRPQIARALIRRDLPNLQRALELFLEMGPWEDAIDMAGKISTFLTLFGFERERDALRRKVGTIITSIVALKHGVLTRAEWQYESSLGEDAWSKGAVREATVRFITLLERIEILPEGASCARGSYEHSLTLQWLARCLETAGQVDSAEEYLYKALNIIHTLIEQAPEHQDLISQRASLLTSLGDVQCAQGHYAQAHNSYEESLQLDQFLGDLRGQAVVLGQLGTLALQQKDVVEARQRYISAIEAFRSLDDLPMEAIAWYQIGVTAHELKEWAEAERCYRNSLEIMEQLGDERGAAGNCNQLAIVAEKVGRLVEAEGWYKRALELDERVSSDSLSYAAHLNNLADLLLSEVQANHASKERLGEARGYAERALAIKEKFDASAAIWTTFGILARIVELAGQETEARMYRRYERKTFADFAGNRYFIDQRFGPLIMAITVAAQGDTHAQMQIQAVLPELEARGWHITWATQRIWAGEHDWHLLTEMLDRRSALLVLRVLEEVAKPPEVQGRVPAHLIASLPETIHTLLEHENVSASEQKGASR